MEEYRFLKSIGFLVAVLSLFILGTASPKNAIAQQDYFWVGVDRAGINSHQLSRPWCPEGTYLVAFDLDSKRNYAPHDSPVVGQAMCRPDPSRSYRWGSTTRVGVETAGINSHQAGPPWCPQGTFLVAFDQDGPRHYRDTDSPVIGQAMCAAPANPAGRWGTCFWVEVQNSHQPGPPWCPEGTFLVAFDLDGGPDPYDYPVVGRAMCCSLP